MSNKVITWSEGQIVVRPALVEDEIATTVIMRDLSSAYPEGKLGYFGTFAGYCAQTVSSAGLPFHPENVRDMSRPDKCKAYEEFLKLPRALRIKWNEACEAADGVSDYALGPDPLPESAPKNL